MAKRQFVDRDARRDVHVPRKGEVAQPKGVRSKPSFYSLSEPRKGESLYYRTDTPQVPAPSELSAAIDRLQEELEGSVARARFGSDSCVLSAEVAEEARRKVTLPPPSVEDRLREARAERELQRLREMRIVVEAADENLTQRGIADLLGRSQSDVFRMLKAARARRDVAGESVREIILNYVVRDITRGELVGRLTDLQHGSTQGPDLSDGYQHGTFDDVKVAWLDGLIDDDLYEEIRQTNHPTDSARHRAAAEQ